MRFEYWKSGDGQWTWRLRSAVNDLLASGGDYRSRESCLAAIKLVKLAAGAASVEVSDRAALGDGPATLRLQPA
jgi:uncharacterized protein YegP (UPF0339 family)